jgi:pimeloyl-ACP methyl ester carboxylesterase
MKQRPGHRIERDGQHLYYEVYGSGPPVLLLHSFLCSIELWDDQIAALRQDYQVIAMDIRGHGRSGHSLPHTLESLVDDALAVLDAEGISAAHWCGLSIGGMISIRAAIREPGRVRSLILMDTDAGPEKRGVVFRHWLLEAAVRVLGLKSVKGPVMDLMFGRSTHQDQPELVEIWGNRFEELHVPSMMRTLRALDRRRDLVPLLSGVHRPALVIHGDEDRALSRRRGQLIADTLPRAEWLLLRRVGHLCTLEAPDAVNERLVAFLAKHTQG